MKIVFGVCVFAVFLLAAAGCGGSGKDDESRERLEKMTGGPLKGTVSITGHVLVDGKPMAGVNLYLFPISGGTSLRQCRTNAEGMYCWSTYVNCDGLEAGSYRIAFRLIPEEHDNENSEVTDDLFMSRYSNPTKVNYPLTVEANSPKTDVDYDLKMN